MAIPGHSWPSAHPAPFAVRDLSSQMIEIEPVPEDGPGFVRPRPCLSIQGTPTTNECISVLRFL